MGIKLKKFSHSVLLKMLIFILLLSSVIGGVYSTLHLLKITEGNIEIIFENSYLESSSFQSENYFIMNQLIELIDVYKDEENILAGNLLDENELADRLEQTEHLYSDEENSEKPSKKEIEQDMISEDLRYYKRILNNVEKLEEPLYYVTDGDYTLTNTEQTKQADFKQYPVYYISEGLDWEIHPEELRQTNSFYGYSHVGQATTPEKMKVFIGYTDNYVKKVTKEWEEDKSATMNAFYYLLAYMVLFFLCLLYLMITTGKKSFKDEKIYMNPIDKLYVDVQILLLFLLPVLWFGTGIEMRMINWMLYPFTLFIVIICLTFLLSIIRHMKNKTFFSHSIIYLTCRWLYRFVKDIYNSGSVGMKVVIAVIVYPIIAAATLFFFPITIGVAVWLALKQVKKFNKIQEGAKLMKEGNLQHYIDIDGKGEFAALAANINGINEGFKQAVHNELKNERMKTELITNVSHDIRTPLTSLITYTDLLKTETDPEKMQEYIDILEQKSKRLEVLTDDLFAAAKASSGDIPVNLEEIDIVALINQGIGEVSEQISAKSLIFKFNYPKEKMYVIADGKLLWRSIENILSNIFNYALEGSRIYIDIMNQNDKIQISFKNISKYELNITEAELMERFKRGDESRSSHGSGLGLAITQSLIENQNGEFAINIDGDLFKSIIYLPSSERENSLDIIS